MKRGGGIINIDVYIHWKYDFKVMLNKEVFRPSQRKTLLPLTLALYKILNRFHHNEETSPQLNAQTFCL